MGDEGAFFGDGDDEFTSIVEAAEEYGGDG